MAKPVTIDRGDKELALEARGQRHHFLIASPHSYPGISARVGPFSKLPLIWIACPQKRSPSSCQKSKEPPAHRVIDVSFILAMSMTTFFDSIPNSFWIATTSSIVAAVSAKICKRSGCDPHRHLDLPWHQDLCRLRLAVFNGIRTRFRVALGCAGTRRDFALESKITP